MEISEEKLAELHHRIEDLSYALDKSELDAVFKVGGLIRSDLRDLPVAPSTAMLRLLVHAGAMGAPEWVGNMGKSLQRTHRGTVPYKTEYEFAAGTWVLMRRGLIKQKRNPRDDKTLMLRPEEKGEKQ